jgi:RNA polymerase sigma-70 factor (ECF subfamily)
MTEVESSPSQGLLGLAPRSRAADDSGLLRAYAAGDRDAAEQLVAQSYGAVFALLRRLCGDSDLAADLTQESYRKAWAALRQFDGRSSFATWVCRIGYNVFLNQLRRPRRLVPLEERVEATASDPSPSVEELVGATIASDKLRRAVMSLDEGLRFPVAAFYWGDVPVAEIARQLEITTVAVRKRMRKALQLLALALEEGS